MRAAQIAGLTLASFATAGLGYAVYFDYKRRNDPNFLKQLKKEAKKTSKAQKRDVEVAKKRMQQVVQTVVREINQPGALPPDIATREKYFMEQLNAGETLITLGPAGYEQAASAFFRAIKVYPQPVDLLMIFQKATPEEVFSLIMMMIEEDQKVAGSNGLDDVDAGGAGSQNPLAALAGMAQSAPQATGSPSGLEEIEDEPTSKPSMSSASMDEEAASTGASGPSSQASSQEWDKLSGASLGPSPPVDSTNTPGTSSSASTAQPADATSTAANEAGADVAGDPNDGVSSANEASTSAVETATVSATPSAEGEAGAPVGSPFNFAAQSYAPSPIFKEGGESEK